MHVVSQGVQLSGYTTLRLGGPASRFVQVGTATDLVGAVREADLAGEPVLVLGGGSNLVIADSGFPGIVVRVVTTGVRVSQASDGVRVTAAAGENWDRLVPAIRAGSNPPPLRYIAMAYKSNFRELPSMIEWLFSERRAWKVEIRDTYLVDWIPQEFRETATP